MPLETDRLIDRRRLKRQLTYWRVLAALALVGAVAAAVGRFEPLTDKGHVARLVIDGLILDDRWRDTALGRIADDESARALIVRIDSPGGTFIGGETLYRSLRKVGEAKPVVAVMGGTATSAGYMAALGAEHIVAHSGSVTGSIGVILQTADVTGLLEKLGVKAETIKSGSLKAQPNPLEPFSPEARKAIRDVVLDLYDIFVDMVAERRGLPREGVLALADGRVFTGRQAMDHGLIDILGGESAARRWLESTHGIPQTLPVRNVKIEREGERWRELIMDAIGKALFSERLRLDGFISLWHPDLR